MFSQRAVRRWHSSPEKLCLLPHPWVRSRPGGMGPWAAEPWGSPAYSTMEGPGGLPAPFRPKPFRDSTATHQLPAYYTRYKERFSLTVFCRQRRTRCKLRLKLPTPTRAGSSPEAARQPSPGSAPQPSSAAMPSRQSFAALPLRPRHPRRAGGRAESTAPLAHPSFPPKESDGHGGPVTAAFLPGHAAGKRSAPAPPLTGGRAQRPAPVTRREEGGAVPGLKLPGGGRGRLRRVGLR